MTESTLTDAEAEDARIATLLGRVAHRDREAFESLYRRTSGKLLGICLRVLTDRSEAEDVLQDVFVTIWDKAAQFDAGRARALTWLGSITRNRAIDRLRALPSPASRAPIEWADDAPDPSPSPAAQTESAFERARLDTCLDGLEPKRKVLIRTAFFEGATYEELAERSGSPLGSIKSWIRRGLQQLKACLEQ